MTEIQETIAGDVDYKGKLQVKWVSQPLNYSLLLRDTGLQSELVQVGIYTYANFENRPYFRAAQYGSRLATSMQNDFKHLWESDKR